MPSQVVFTKVDETSAPGGLLSVPAVTPWPVAAVANGQRVPEDLQALGDAELVDLVLGESRWTLGRN
jgi:flagellar biosynthesis GTPase FlhF